MSMQAPSIDRLVAGIKKTQAPICVGLDPQLNLIPDVVKQPVFAELGSTPEGAAEAILRFNRAIVDATADLIPAVKPQIAMYEQFGIPGLEAFQKTVDYCQEKGLIVIGDVKRGDIGSTSAAYAKAHLGSVEVGEASFSPFHEDFCTVNPYLGTDGVLPFMKECASYGRGIFVLVKTSNPSSGEFQDQLVLTADETDGPSALHAAGDPLKALLQSGKNAKLRPLYELVGRKVAQWAQETSLIGESGYSAVGAVVGATYPEMGRVLRDIMPKSFILVPGYGAQGGSGADLVPFFNEDGLGAIVNSSRGIIAAWQKAPCAERFREEAFAEAARAAVLDMKEDIAKALG